MDNFMSLDSFHAKKEKVMMELVKGKEIAVQLQTLLKKPVRDHGPVSPEQLAFQIYRSFSATLSELSSCTGPTGSDQIPAVDGGVSASSADCKKKQSVKDRRGCYKRRRTSDSWVILSPTIEDGYAWRKYGQKAILNSENPRSYFRCTHKHAGCKAIKQVQKVKGDQMLYQITYFNHHTCKETLRAPSILVESDPVDPNLISFQTSTIPSQQQDDEDHDRCKDLSKSMIVSSVKHEDNLSDQEVSTLEDPWHDITGLEPSGYKPVWGFYQDEVESASLHGFDMEVNQLSDIHNFHYFD